MKKLYIPPTLIAYCLVVMILFYFFIPQFNFIVFPYNLAGLIISFLGFIIMGKARDLFRKHETTLKIKTSSQLIIEGVFTKTRNPMYLGMTILILGFSICSTNLLSLILPLLFMIFVSQIFISKEEKLMADTFGDEYLEYKKKVRRWI
ncbi:MAG: isoprenylcysteine carboxylmethyltransferase family protein [Saprospiraceae bacterium]|nr:isoprenylcysteine carboxylmethyltransferase family protein [Saprospiraceae bacterium]